MTTLKLKSKLVKLTNASLEERKRIYKLSKEQLKKEIKKNTI